VANKQFGHIWNTNIFATEENEFVWNLQSTGKSNDILRYILNCLHCVLTLQVTVENGTTRYSQGSLFASLKENE
jgi:hypothetical protein